MDIVDHLPNVLSFPKALYKKRKNKERHQYMFGQREARNHWKSCTIQWIEVEGSRHTITKIYLPHVGMNQ